MLRNAKGAVQGMVEVVELEKTPVAVRAPKEVLAQVGEVVGYTFRTEEIPQIMAELLGQID